MENTDNKILKVTDLQVKFGDNIVLQNINFDVTKGDAVAIVGPNGAGKSVLLRTLLGLIPFSGDVDWAPNIKTSYVPQKLSIDSELPLSVDEFFELKTSNKEEVRKILDQVGLGSSTSENEHISKHILRQRLGWLSGGQLQRVMVAWALIDNPDVLLLDEPTTGIDIGGEETIFNLLSRLKYERKFTMLLISHELNIVYKYANTVICLNKDMICYGLPSEVLDPAALAKLYGGEAGFYKHEHE